MSIDSVKVHYPSSDGQPLGETEQHLNWIFDLYDRLRHHYRERDVKVCSNLLVYYEELNTRKFLVPDVFVAKDVSSKQRRVFKTWEEGKAPDVVFELLSISTGDRDLKEKPEQYAFDMGAKELIIIDVDSEFGLDTPVLGYRLSRDSIERIEPDADGLVYSSELHIKFGVEPDVSVIAVDCETGQRLLTAAESEAERVDALEAEVQRLREQLKKQQTE